MQLISNETNQYVISLLRTLHYRVCLEIKPMLGTNGMNFPRVIPSNPCFTGAILSSNRKYCSEICFINAKHVLQRSNPVKFMLV